MKSVAEAAASDTTFHEPRGPDERVRVDPDLMELRRSLVERVKGVRPSGESETTLGSVGDEMYFYTITYNRTWVKSILQHEYISIQWLWLEVDGEGYRGERVDSIREVVEEHEGQSIEGICCYIPIGCLTIKGVPRKHDSLSRAINTPDQVQQAREAFGGGVA